MELAQCVGLVSFGLRGPHLLKTYADLFDSLPATVKVVRFTFVDIGIGNHTHLGADSEWAEFDDAFTSNAFQERHARMTLEIDLLRAREVSKAEGCAALQRSVEAGLPRIQEQGKLTIYNLDSTIGNWWGELKSTDCVVLPAKLKYISPPEL